MNVTAVQQRVYESNVCEVSEGCEDSLLSEDAVYGNHHDKGANHKKANGHDFEEQTWLHIALLGLQQSLAALLVVGLGPSFECKRSQVCASRHHVIEHSSSDAADNTVNLAQTVNFDTKDDHD